MENLFSPLSNKSICIVTLSGGEGTDAKSYQERQVTKAIVDSNLAD